MISIIFVDSSDLDINIRDSCSVSALYAITYLQLVIHPRSHLAD